MSTSIPTFAFGNRLGLFILAEISAVSATAVVVLLGYIFALELYLGHADYTHWIFLYSTRVPMFNAAGLIKQLGDVGTALSALIFRLKPDTNVPRAWLIVAGIWIFIILAVTINIGINGCWIVEEFHVQRTVVDFMWMWISAFSSVLAYIPVFLVLKGFVRVEGWRVQWTYGSESRTIPQSHRLAYNMLSYPILYIITVLPLTAARYESFAGKHTPFGVTIFADGLYLASGLFNVLLYTYTRPFLLPHGNDSLEDQSIAIHSEFAPSQSDLPGSTILGDVHALNSSPSPVPPKGGDPAYEVPEMVHRHNVTISVTTHGSGDHGHVYENSGDRGWATR
ncbi:hypothetical protein BC834DRAFT_839809 [Gloeopeniophorella convolvens]|nr:hypothetical protein BC834DRAFT_839809 [Gloeopeniophorella convolvens]